MWTWKMAEELQKSDQILEVMEDPACGGNFFILLSKYKIYTEVAPLSLNLSKQI